MSERFNLTKLQNLDNTEIEKVAQQLKNGRLTLKQQGLIGYYSKPALEAIQDLAKIMSYSQKTALQSNIFANSLANDSLRYVIQTSSSAEEKRDAYRHSENINCETVRANVQMNKDNNDTYKYFAVAASVGAAILGIAYFSKSKE